MPASCASFRQLVAKLVELLRTRTDEYDPRRRARPGELRVLRKKPVARVNRVHFLGLGQLDDRLDAQVAANRLARRADLVRLVGLESMKREPVFVRIDRHGPDAQLMRRPKDPDRDLAAIGDHQLAKGGHQRSSSSSASTGFSSVPIGSIVVAHPVAGLEKCPGCRAHARRSARRNHVPRL